MTSSVCLRCFFFFNDTATTEIYTLSLHDALPILWVALWAWLCHAASPDVRSTSLHTTQAAEFDRRNCLTDRKSTRLNSSHANISYAVFCLKKKNESQVEHRHRTAITLHKRRALCS